MAALPSTPAPAPAIAATLTPCFTPGSDCTSVIVQRIDAAKSELLVQAYGFTSTPIISAIANAKTRGVDVRVILDKSNETRKYSGATFLVNHGIEPLIDDSVGIAHNKVLIIDKDTVVTGSFNFTTAAQKRNAENVLIIEDDHDLVAAYRDNWFKRAAVSRPYRPREAAAD